MGIVRGDRVGESQRLNRRPVEAQDFYAALVASVPDDFGRFRLSASHVSLRMYPRREPSPGLLKRVNRLLGQLGQGVDEDGGLWASWEVDGVTFAELRNWKASGNRYHRTPEPPDSAHEHQGACLSTAIHRAREWGALDEAERLSRRLKEIRDRKPTGAAPGAHRRGAPPSPPSPPSPLNDPPDPPEGGPGSRADVCTSTAERKARKAQLRNDVDDAERYWLSLGRKLDPELCSGIRAALREGRPLSEILASMDKLAAERAETLGFPDPDEAA